MGSEGARDREGRGATHGRVRESSGVPAPVLVGGIALLVVLVSMPRFRAHAIAANRADARIALDVLGSVVFSGDWRDATQGDGDLMDVIEGTPMLAHRFPDAERDATGRQILHHGYRIDTGYVVQGIARRPALVAWPIDYDRTGDAAFALASDGALWGHDNGGRWSSGAGELVTADLVADGWIPLRAAHSD